MTLHEYLQSEQAREDVRQMLARNTDILRCPGGDLWLVRTTLRAWTRLEIQNDTQTITAYYRPDGDRYIVTDMGEGVRAMRLRTGDILARADQIYDGTNRTVAELIHAWPSPLPAALSDAICRVMLASLKVSEVTP